jgi:hypothetical protein
VRLFILLLPGVLSPPINRPECHCGTFAVFFVFTTKLSTSDRDVGFRHKITVVCMWKYIAGK